MCLINDTHIFLKLVLDHLSRPEELVLEIRCLEFETSLGMHLYPLGKLRFKLGQANIWILCGITLLAILN